MGAPKALLPDGTGRVFITRILHTFYGAGVSDITVVSGSLHAEIVRAVAADVPRNTLVRFARNPDPARGQLSSLIIGLDAAAAPGVTGVLMTLVDVPFVTAATVRAVISAAERMHAPIARPASGDRHGHPVFFRRSMFDDLRRADPAAGAKAVIRARAGDVVNVEVADAGALLDLDTRAQYERVIRS